MRAAIATAAIVAVAIAVMAGSTAHEPPPVPFPLVYHRGGRVCVVLSNHSGLFCAPDLKETAP
jgi:hypothetical protein